MFRPEHFALADATATGALAGRVVGIRFAGAVTYVECARGRGGARGRDAGAAPPPGGSVGVVCARTPRPATSRAGRRHEVPSGVRSLDRRRAARLARRLPARRHLRRGAHGAGRLGAAFGGSRGATTSGWRSGAASGSRSPRSCSPRRSACRSRSSSRAPSSRAAAARRAGRAPGRPATARRSHRLPLPLRRERSRHARWSCAPSDSTPRPGG